jgi:hypothetical protein
MRNFSITIVNNTYHIYFNQDLVGWVNYSETEGGYLVTPYHARYTGFFKNLETAITELVFHTYSKHTAIPTC